MLTPSIGPPVRASISGAERAMGVSDCFDADALEPANSSVDATPGSKRQHVRIAVPPL